MIDVYVLTLQTPEKANAITVYCQEHNLKCYVYSVRRGYHLSIACTAQQLTEIKEFAEKV